MLFKVERPTDWPVGLHLRPSRPLRGLAIECVCYTSTGCCYMNAQNICLTEYTQTFTSSYINEERNNGRFMCKPSMISLILLSVSGATQHLASKQHLPERIYDFKFMICVFEWMFRCEGVNGKARKCLWNIAMLHTCVTRGTSIWFRFQGH